MYNLSDRLQAIADMVIAGEPVADIGSDHAYLPLFLVENNVVPWAIAGELGDGPYKRALQALSRSAMQERIELRQGDGLQVLAFAEVSTVIIAGLGGDSIAAILEYDWQKSGSFKRFILQPMSRAGVLRKCLADRGWPIAEEKLVMENEQYFPIIISQPGSQPYQLDELEAEIGPQILQSNDKIKRGLIVSYVEKYGKVYRNLIRSTQPENHVLAQKYLEMIQRLEVILDASHGKRY